MRHNLTDTIFEKKDLKKQDLSKIQDLWNQNSLIHSKMSRFFKKKFDKTMFQKRLSAWENTEILKITAVQMNSEIIGYCISSIEKEKGLIESLFVIPEQRKKGVGRKLIESHIEWFKINRCSSVEVTTVYGNDDAVDFYKSIGILPKTITMRLSDKCTNDN